MPHPGELLGGRYRLDDRIAAGGMGEVWQATDTVLERAVAVKTMLADRATDRGFQRRFRHEARALAALRHPGVVPVYDFGSTDAEDAYLVMARVDGEPLNRLLARRGRLTPAETMSVVAQAAQALEAAHTAGIVHRDVKPGNLLIEPDGTVVLVDFGVARSAHSGTVTGAGEVVGTALYIAPEQVARQETGPAADVYALGALAFHCLAGHPPFQGQNPIAIALQHLDDDPPPLPDEIPAEVREMVRIALAKDPAARFPSAGAMAATASSAAARMTAATTGSTGTGGVFRGGDRPDDTAGQPGPDSRAASVSGAGAGAGGIAVSGGPLDDGREDGSAGLAATRAGAPWIGVVGMQAFDTTSGGFGSANAEADANANANADDSTDDSAVGPDKTEAARSTRRETAESTPTTGHDTIPRSGGGTAETIPAGLTASPASGDSEPSGPGTDAAAAVGTGAGGTGAGGTRPAAPARTGLLATVDGRTGKRRLLPMLILAAVVLFGVVGVLAATDPFGLFSDDPKATTSVPATPASSIVRPSSGETGRGNAGEAPKKPEKSGRNQDAGARSPGPAATTTGPAEAPATTEPTGEATTGTTSAPEQTATSPAETGDPEENETEPAENENG